MFKQAFLFSGTCPGPDPGTNIQPLSVNVSETYPDRPQFTMFPVVFFRFLFCFLKIITTDIFFQNGRHQGLGFGENLRPPGEESTHRPLRVLEPLHQKPTVHSWQHRLWPGKVPMDGPYSEKRPIDCESMRNGGGGIVCLR